MFNSRVSILPIFLALVLIYLIIGDCLLLKLLLSGIGLFLLYINFLPSKESSCRRDDCFVSPIDGEIKSVDYNNDTATIVIATKLYNPALLTMPKNGYVQIKKSQGMHLGLQSKLAKKLNQYVEFQFEDGSMHITSEYLPIDCYVESDRYFIGDVIGRVFCGEISITLDGYDVKVVAGDKVKTKTQVLAYKNEL